MGSFSTLVLTDPSFDPDPVANFDFLREVSRGFGLESSVSAAAESSDSRQAASEIVIANRIPKRAWILMG